MTFSELFFEVDINLSERFPALTPFSIRRTKASEVFLLLRRMTDYNAREAKRKTPNGKNIIWRKANDTWF